MRGRPEDVAAVVNGLIVVLAPLLFLVVGSCVSESHTNTSTTVRAPGVPMLGPLLSLGQIAVALLPLAVIAGWRTRVHSIRWRTGQSSGWRGVAEAGACGLGFALLYLSRGIVTRPLEAPPYVIVYGGGALILGLLVGLVLRTTGVLVLRAYD